MATRFARIGPGLGVIRRNPHLCHSTILKGRFHQTVAGVGTPVIYRGKLQVTLPGHDIVGSATR